MVKKTVQTRKLKQIERTAYHEAGHVVAAWHFRFGFGTTTIRRNLQKDSRGHVEIGNPLDGWQRGDGPRRELFEEYTVISYAGYATEHILDGKSGDYEVFGNDEINPLTMMRMYGLFPPGCISDADESTIAPYKKKLRRRTLKLMKELFPQVKNVKSLLIERRTIEADDVHSLLGEPQL